MITLAFLLLLADSPKKPALDEQQLKKFAGGWAVLAQEHGGKKVPLKELTPLSVVVAGNKFTTRENNDVKEESVVVLLDTKARPAAIDLEITSGGDKGKVVKGIYKFDDDKLTVCVAEPGKDRPREFAGKEGTGHTLLVLLRQKKK